MSLRLTALARKKSRVGKKPRAYRGLETLNQTDAGRPFKRLTSKERENFQVPPGEWNSRSAVTAARNAGVYSFSCRWLVRAKLIIGLFSNEVEFLQAAGEFSANTGHFII